MFDDGVQGGPGATPMAATAEPRRWWLAGLFSLAVCGFGQVYNGQPGRGLLLFLLQWPLLYFASRTTVSPAPFAVAVALLLLYVLLRTYAIGDAIGVARRSPLPLKHRVFDRWYVYLAACIVLYPFSVLGLTRVTQSQAASFYIPSAPMADTLVKGDSVYARPWDLRDAPRHGEIVIFHSVDTPRALVVSRCVALPGEVVKIANKRLYVDGQPIDDSAYARHKDPSTFPAFLMSRLSARDNFGPLTVPAGTFFALGDNRDYCWDSRFFGPVPQSSLVAGGLLRIYKSFDSSHGWRFARIGALVR